MKQATQTKIEKFLSDIGKDLEFDLAYNVNIDELDLSDPDNIFDSIRDMLDDAGAFNVEIIYYSRAMEYLQKYDNSLRTSLELAGDMGYKPEDLSSEILASLLASQNSREEFADLETQITDFFTELAEEENENEEEEEEESK